MIWIVLGVFLICLGAFLLYSEFLRLRRTKKTDVFTEILRDLFEMVTIGSGRLLAGALLIFLGALFLFARIG